jgi:hypothetical protein
MVELNHLTWLIARENFIILSRRESNKSQMSKDTYLGIICNTLEFCQGVPYVLLRQITKN